VTVCPLFSGGESAVDYVLAEEAMEAGTLVVNETSEAGSIHELRATNDGDKPVLIVEGDELRGAKQNRAVVATVLIAAGSSEVVPVVCIERGRWSGSSSKVSSGLHLPPTMRRTVKEGSARSKSKGRRCADQRAVWTEIRRRHRSMGVSSWTDNLSDAVRNRRKRIDELRVRLPYVDGASGIAVALGNRVAALDLFDKPVTLKKVWDRLVLGLGLELPGADRQIGREDVLTQLYSVREMNFRAVPQVGLGKTYLCRDAGGVLGAALVVDDVPLHLSVSFPAAEK
jgi:hypothetical protein